MVDNDKSCAAFQASQQAQGAYCSAARAVAEGLAADAGAGAQQGGVAAQQHTAGCQAACSDPPPGGSSRKRVRVSVETARVQLATATSVVVRLRQEGASRVARKATVQLQQHQRGLAGWLQRRSALADWAPSGLAAYSDAGTPSVCLLAPGGAVAVEQKGCPPAGPWNPPIQLQVRLLTGVLVEGQEKCLQHLGRPPACLAAYGETEKFCATCWLGTGSNSVGGVA